MELPRIAKQHQIDSNAQDIFKSHFNETNGFLVRELPRDYGIDYLIELIDDKEETTGILFNVQLKGSKNLRVSNNAISISMKKTTLNLYTRQLYPTIIVVIDVSSKTGFWNNSIEIIDELDHRKPLWRSEVNKTVSVRIPISQDFSDLELTKLKEYTVNVHSRRSAIPQGSIFLMLPDEQTNKFTSIRDLAKIIDACAFDKFFQIISIDPFRYLDDVNLTKLSELFSKIPPDIMQTSRDAMSLAALTAYDMGYYQEAKKWGKLVYDEDVINDELNDILGLILSEIDFMFDQISQNDFSEKLKKAYINASEKFKANIKIRQIVLNFWANEQKARQYGRFRQMDLIKATIKELWNYFHPESGHMQAQVLLLLAHQYLILIPGLYSEIEATPLLRQRVGLTLKNSELELMKQEAINRKNEAEEVFSMLIGNNKSRNVPLSLKAEGYFTYSQFIYYLILNVHNKLIFLKEFLKIPEIIPLSQDEKNQILKSLEYSEIAKDLFRRIGAKDRETTTLIYILGYYEDLGYNNKYEETKKEIKHLLKTVWEPNAVKLFEMTIKEGSLRRAKIHTILSRKQTTDSDTVRMSDTEIETQVECNSRTFNIKENYKIDNLRKGVISSILAAKFRLEVCRYFVLQEDKRHSRSLETMFTVDPNRKGYCQLLGNESKIVTNDAKTVIDAFSNAYCLDCKYKEPSIN